MDNIKIQLTDPIEGYLDLTEDTDFPITLAVAEIRDITKRKGTFSKSIKLAGTKNNNKLLNKYFDVNVIDGTFNIRRLTKCIVLENNVPILENVYLQLVEVKKIQTTNQHDKLVEYTIIIKDAVSDFFTKLGKAELTDLNFSGYDHLYTAANVSASWMNTEADVYKYVMPWNPGNVYQLKEWQPGIYLKQYFDRIISNAGFSYEWATLTDNNFDKIIVPYNGDEPALDAADQDDYTVEAYLSTPHTVIENPTPTGTNVTYYEQVIMDIETFDPAGLYDPVLGEYDSFFYFSGGSSNLNYQFEIDFDIVLNNTSGATAYAVTDNLVFTNYGSFRYTPKAVIFKNGNQQGAVNIKQGITPYQQFTANGQTLANGKTTVYSGTNVVNIPSAGIAPGDIITTKFGILFQQGLMNYPAKWRNANSQGAPLVDVNWELVINEVSVKIVPSVSSIGYNSIVKLNKFVPKKVKQTDVIKAIVQMYNLYIDIDKSNPNKLLIYTRDEYYDAGGLVDWTDKLNKNKDQNLKFLSELTKKKTVLTYKQDDKDEMLKSYKALTNEVYGQIEYTYDSDFVKDTEVKEIIFSPTYVLDSTFGAVFPSFTGPKPNNNIKVVFDGGMFPCSTFQIQEYLGSNISYTSYPLFSHFDHPTNPTFDINFGICDYNYTSLAQFTNNNLYNLYWRRTLNQINNSKMLIAYFDLTGKDIQDLKLNSKIRIDNSYWNINKISDYNPTKLGPTKVELISIDDELALGPFKTSKPTRPSKPVEPARPSKPTPGTGPIRPIKFISDKYFNDNNVNASNDTSKIFGVNNVISTDSKNVEIIGNNNNINSYYAKVIGSDNFVYSNATVDGDNNVVESEGTVIGDNNIVPPGLDGVFVIGDNVTATESGLYVNNLTVTGNVVLPPGYTVTPPLSNILGYGNTTGGSDIIMTSGDTIISDTSDIIINLNSSGGFGINTDILYIKNNTVSNITTTNNDKWGVFISARNSTIHSAIYNTVLIGGDTNLIQKTTGTSNNSIIGGGTSNTIADTDRAIILGGTSNLIDDISVDSVILGGTSNKINNVAESSVILGGDSNTISGADAAAILAGTNNTINSTAHRSTILAGSNITATSTDTAYAENLVVTNQVSADLNINANMRVKDINHYYTNLINTLNATATTIKTIAVPSSTTYIIEATVIGMQADDTKAISAKIRGTYRNNAGTITLVGSVVSDIQSEFTTATVSLVISGTNVLVQVTGEAATDIDWSVNITTHYVQTGVI